MIGPPYKFFTVHLKFPCPFGKRPNCVVFADESKLREHLKSHSDQDLLILGLKRAELDSEEPVIASLRGADTTKRKSMGQNTDEQMVSETADDDIQAGIIHEEASNN